MCVPVAVGLAIASTALAAGGQIAQGIQARKMGDYQAAVAHNNEQQSAYAAADALQRGRVEAYRQSRQQAQLQGQQRVAEAGSGVETTFGTSSDLATDAAMIGSENNQTILENANRESRGYSINASNYRSQGAAAKVQGSNAFTNSLFSAGSTILSGASQVAKMGGGSAPKLNYDTSGF